MYRIGEFSALSKTTIKTLRYYEKEKLLIPSYVDKETGYRFYETSQLLMLSKILSLRQIGISINKIKQILNGESEKDILNNQKEQIKKELSIYNDQLSRINYLLEGKNMKYEVIIKESPEYIVYYKEGIVKKFSDLTGFILQSAEECKKINPNIKCIEPDYCFISYLDKEYKENNIKVRYSQAVNEFGKESDAIKFEKLKPVKLACIYHKGSYNNLGNAYSFIINWLEQNNYEIIDSFRERYIDGMWNKDNEEDWLTEIQIPVTKNN